MALKDNLMDVLKERFISVIGDREFNGVKSVSQGPYYLKHLRDNLFEELSPTAREAYGRGQGSELKWKMKALRSSSAMTFNLLGNGPVVINANPLVPPATYMVEFEHQLATLKTSSRKANLDAWLMGQEPEEHRIITVACEMKMTEWIFNSAMHLKDAYLHAGNYLIPEAAADVFVDVFGALCAERDAKVDMWKPRLRRYDAFQMLKHMLAIYMEYNRCHEDEKPLPSLCVLINCVWEVEHPHKLGEYEGRYREMLEEEHEQYAMFSETVAPIVGLFKKLGVDFKLAYRSYGEFASMLEMSDARKRYLQRYEV